MPLDFIKGGVQGIALDDILHRPNLSFIPVLGAGGVVRYYYTEQDKMKVKVFETGYIEISGSIHKFYNNGGHNWNVFTYDMFQEALKRLYDCFGLKPHNIHLQTVEYGYNITPPIETCQILYGLQEHKGQPFSSIQNDNGHYFQATHKQYWLKIYDKAKQYSLNNQTLRMEVKDKAFHKWRDKAGIFTLKDFIRWDKKPLIENILTRWDEVTFYDFTMSTDEYESYSNPTFWHEARKRLERNGVKYHRDKLRQLNKTHGTDLQQRVKEVLIDEINRLRT